VKHIAMDEEVLRGGKVGFTLNNELWPNVTPLSATLGSTEIWEIENKTHMDHPFHLHGFPFQVLSTQKLGDVVVDESFLANKDVFIVPPQTTLRFAVTYAGFPGMWMFHCHILEHAERGMMSMIDVE
jgi:FtsP/CotA-like multicopper oxidase with cupredoxin domain